MKLGQARHFIFAFLLAVIGYAALYAGIQQWRARKGPWTVRFVSSPTNAPRIVIDQPRLGITNVALVFSSAPATGDVSTTVRFDRPRPLPWEMPIGACVFLDTTFLPGTVTIRAHGHEIELLPRVLVINHEAKPWVPGQVIELGAAPVPPSAIPAQPGDGSTPRVAQ